MLKAKHALFIGLSILLASCHTYRKNIMLQTESSVNSQVEGAAPNYTIQVNDILKLQVFTNSGERVLDPDMELSKELGNIQNNRRAEVSYIVNADGTVKFPLLGAINITGKTLREAEQELQQQYSAFYTDPFVALEFSNKRVTVIGVVNQVVPLANENTRLIEVLSLANAIDNNAIVQNIRLVRGNEVFVLDLSHATDIQKTNMIMQPGDIIYIEPVRRPFIEAVKDYGPIISLISSITAIVVIIATI